jgi:hypothetical protein
LVVRSCWAATLAEPEAALSLGPAGSADPAGEAEGPGVDGVGAIADGGFALAVGAGVDAQPPMTMLSRTAADANGIFIRSDCMAA